MNSLKQKPRNCFIDKTLHTVCSLHTVLVFKQKLRDPIINIITGSLNESTLYGRPKVSNKLAHRDVNSGLACCTSVCQSDLLSGELPTRHYNQSWAETAREQSQNKQKAVLISLILLMYQILQIIFSSHLFSVIPVFINFTLLLHIHILHIQPNTFSNNSEIFKKHKRN